MACQAQYYRITRVVALPMPLFVERAAAQDMMAPAAGWEKCRQKLSALVDALASSAAASDIDCMDFYHLFLDGEGRLLKQYFLEDGLHPNREGHRRMAVRAVEFFRERFYLA